MPDRFRLIVSCARQSGSSPPNGEHRRAFDEAFIAAVSQQSLCSITIIPHLYDLPSDGPVFQHLQTFEEHLIVATWLPSRAAFWVLATAGVSGARATLDKQPSGDDRRIWCLDLTKFDQATDGLDVIRRILSNANPPKSTEDTQIAVEWQDEPVGIRWYPVIDRDRCVNCLECLNFCLFGVYDLDAVEHITVQQPNACRPGCPACARVCPAGAIMFPEHTDPDISGDSAESKKNKSEKTPSPPSPSSVHSETENRLDKLVDGLDDVDL